MISPVPPAEQRSDCREVGCGGRTDLEKFRFARKIKSKRFS
jgi:hypothetical protein